ncbi:hypothetical protein [Agrococcus casei]|uniref:hypothetical protein n=2 Tax=Actinomycetes TaxID=1760 RepID=UPI003F934A04
MATADLNAGRAHIDTFLELLTDIRSLYIASSDEVRRALNQAIFNNLYVANDDVTGDDIKQPLRALLAAQRGWMTYTADLGRSAATQALRPSRRATQCRNQKRPPVWAVSWDQTCRDLLKQSSLASTKTVIRVRLLWWKQLGAVGTDDHGFRSSFPHGIKGFATMTTPKPRQTTQ